MSREFKSQRIPYFHTEVSEEETVAAEEETAEETDERDIRAALSDNLPEGLDYEGYEFRILTTQSPTYASEELTGDLVNDAIYERNLEIRERFNTVIKTVPSAGIAELDEEFKASVMAADHTCDIAVPHQIQSGPSFITRNVVRPWNDVPYIDASQPWWNQSCNETLRILGQQYYMTGYITMPTPFCMFANKELLTDYGYSDIYETVREGTWTLDRLSEITSGAYIDLNGDGVADVTDQYGITFNDDNTTLNFMYSSGIHSVIIDESGMPVANVFNDKMISLLDKMYNLIYTNNQTLLTTYSTSGNGSNGFTGGRILFMCGVIGNLSGLRDAEIEIGVIPYPKWDEQQETYSTHVDASNGMLCIPQTATGDAVERIGVITEAMAAYTYKFIIPDYYDVTLGTKYARDEDSREMMDILFDSIIYDFGYIFDEWKGCTWTLPNLMAEKSTDLASYWKKKEKVIKKHYEALYKAIEKNME